MEKMELEFVQNVTMDIMVLIVKINVKDVIIVMMEQMEMEHVMMKNVTKDYGDHYVKIDVYVLIIMYVMMD